MVTFAPATGVATYKEEAVVTVWLRLLPPKVIAPISEARKVA